MSWKAAVWALGLAGMVWTGLSASADEPKKPVRAQDPPQPELLLHYDFYLVEGERVPDASGKKHDGRLTGGQIVSGRRRPALVLEGQGVITADASAQPLDLAGRTLSIGARCRPTSADGVIVAVGDDRNGMSLYIKNAIPHFAVRSAGKLVTVAGPDPVGMDQWVHLFGAIDRRGNVILVSNGWPIAQAKGSALADAGTEPLSVGADDGVPVGDYRGPLPWHGQLESVRVYWGVITRNGSREDLGDWAELPGCGCK